MPVPGFQDIMLPLLEFAGDGQVHKLRDAIPALANYFELTDEERREPLPSGRQSRFDNRVGWANTYLEKCKLVTRPERGTFVITERGREVLQVNPSRIDLKYLSRFPEFDDFHNKKNDREIVSEPIEEETTETVEETFEDSFSRLREQLMSELLDRVKAGSWQLFERIVVDVLLAMGYGGSRKDAGQATQPTNDGGIDGIIKEDRLGLNQIYIQAKKYTDKTVGRPEIQSFAGALDGHRAKKGVFITTSTFASSAYEYVDRIEKTIILIDGRKLAQYMVDYNVGVTIKETYVVKEVLENYFTE